MNLLAKLNQAERLLAETKDLGELKQIHDVAVAAEAYAQAHGMGIELENHAMEIRLLAGRRIGELKPRPTPRESGEKGGRGKKGAPSSAPFPVSRRRLSDFRKLAEIPMPKFREELEAAKVRQEKITYSRVLMWNPHQTLPVAEAPPLPEGVFEVILADPPWRYDFTATKNRAIENQYPTMELGELKTLKIPAAEKAALFLWSTAPKLKEALEVMESWGFVYRTCAIWDKEKIGCGWWFRGQHELLLIGVRGNLSPPAPSDRVSSVMRARRGKHSKKPEVIYEIIEGMFPNSKLLELFARRNERPRWETWGNEA